MTREDLQKAEAYYQEIARLDVAIGCLRGGARIAITTPHRTIYQSGRFAEELRLRVLREYERERQQACLLLKGMGCEPPEEPQA